MFSYINISYKEELHMSFLLWIVVGLIAGALADYVLKDISFGILGKILLGLVGSVVGGFIASSIFGVGTGGLIGQTIVAFLGALLVVYLVGLFSRKSNANPVA
jgi:uncharacterized membrane protein YeaQ/YmgE (transglycosylase-associated protein family)